MMKIFSALVAANFVFGVAPRDSLRSTILEAAMALSGAASEEDFSESEAEAFYDRASSPLSINRASRSRLLSSGLFSAYQVATLVDYRENYGDILSAAELCSVDGFDRQRVGLLSNFLSFETSGPPLGRHYKNIDNSIRLRTSIKTLRKESVSTSTALRYNLNVDEAFELAVGLKESSSFAPRGKQSHILGGGISFCYSSPWKRRGFSLDKVVVGNFNMRFGQGLCLWSGFSMSGFGSGAAFSRNPTGISPYRSWSSESVRLGRSPKWSGGGFHRGATASFSAGRFSFCTAVSFPSESEIMPAVNISHLGRFYRVGITGFTVLNYRGKSSQAKVSVDGAVNIRGVDLWGEVGYDILQSSAALLLGTRAKLCEPLTGAILFRYYPSKYSPSYSGAARSSTRCSDEHGVALALSLKEGDYVDFRPRHLLNITADVAAYPFRKRLQFKFLADYSAIFGASWQLGAKLQYRHRTFELANRLELRLDLVWKIRAWSLAGRVHLLQGEKFGALSYLEGSYSFGNIVSAYLRAGICSTRSWNDRIYAYERDAPGGFNIPAFYGRMIWGSAYLRWSPAKWVKLYLRSSLTAQRAKALKFEGVLQADFRF